MDEDRVQVVMFSVLSILDWHGWNTTKALSPQLGSSWQLFLTLKAAVGQRRGCVCVCVCVCPSIKPGSVRLQVQLLRLLQCRFQVHKGARTFYFKVSVLEVSPRSWNAAETHVERREADIHLVRVRGRWCSDLQGVRGSFSSLIHAWKCYHEEADGGVRGHYSSQDKEEKVCPRSRQNAPETITG